MARVAENLSARDAAPPRQEPTEDAGLLAQLTRGSGWALAGRCGASVGLMAMNALLTRILAPQEVGALFLLLSIVVATASLAQLGLPVAVVNLVGDAVGRRQWGRVRGAISATLRTASGALAAASGLMFVAGPALARQLFHSQVVSAAMTIAAVWLVVRGLQTVLAEVFRALKDLRGAAIHSGILGTMLSVLAFAAIWRGARHASLADLLWISIASAVLDVILSASILRARLARFPRDATSIRMGEVMRRAWPLWGALIVATLARENDLWVLGMFRRPEEVALYGAAARLAAVAAMPLMVVNAVVPPFIAELHGGNRTGELELMLRASASIALAATACVLAVFLFKGRYALAALYGPYYAGGYWVLIIASVAALPDAATGTCGLALMMTGRGSEVLRISLAATTLALALKLMLARRYGGIGVALGTTIGFTAQNFALLYAVRRELGVRAWILSMADSTRATRIFLTMVREQARLGWSAIR